MTSIFSQTSRLSVFLLLLLASVLLVGPAGALERPGPAELEELRQNPSEFRLRQDQAFVFGNHKAKPWAVQHTVAKLKALEAGSDLRSVPPPAWQGMPTSGTNNILVFLIDFPDYPSANTYELITNKLFGAGLPADFPLESLAKFYQRSSYGLLTLKGSTLGWYRMQHPRSWYNATYGSDNECNYQIIKEVAEHFDASIDYGEFDNNHDGLIDYFAVLWSGPDNGWANFWWGYQWSLFSDLTLDGVKFKDFSWQWESRPYGTEFTPVTIIHETGHALGLPDYYDYNGSVGPDGGVGGMDMMDSASFDHNCFSKFMLDWLAPTVVTNILYDFPLRAAADYPDAVALAHGYTGSSPYAEYFMVQNRQKINNDLNLPGAGLAVWHVNAGLNAGGTDFAYNNSYSSLKLLSLVQADGLGTIDREGGGQADAGDFYVSGKELTPDSMPNSRSFSGSNTEVRVTGISVSGAIMTADFAVVDNRPVLPDEPFVSGGEPAASTYMPSNKVYTLANPTASNLTWSVTSGGASWLLITPANTTLAPLSRGTVELSVDQAVAATLPEGVYVETVLFTNTLGLGTTTRQALLRIGQNYTIRSATYQWVDPIASLHTAVGVGSGVSGAYPIPFPVMYYGTMFSNIYISASGLAGFVPQGMESVQNVDLPSGAMPNGMLCALWDNIDGKRLPGKVYYHVDPVSSAPNRKLIITWINIPHVDDFNATFSFQIVIPENALPGINNDILFQYKDVAESRPAVGSGQSATIGIEDEYGALGRKFSFDGENWLANETALLFSQLPPLDVTPPVGTIGALGGASSNVTFEVKFNEAVTGLTASAIAFSTTVPGAGLGEIRGGGMRYLIEVTNVTSLGRIQMGVGAGAVRDLAGNGNVAFGPAIYVVPVRFVNYTDNMENGPALWTASGQDFGYLTTRAWEWGVPDFVDGPALAHSGSNCWGTVLTNNYPNGMNAWVMSSYIDVGPHPVLDFWVWYDLEFGYDFAYVEVDNGSGWQNVTPGGFYGGFSVDVSEDLSGWAHQTIELDNALFSNRSIRVRFRATSDLSITRPGIYVDDLEVSSQREPGLWVVSYTPTNSPPASDVSLCLTVYNSTTNTYGGVNGTLASPDAGVSFTGIIPVAYGTVAPGAQVTNAVPAQMTLGAMGNFDLPMVQLFHQTRAGSTVLSQETLLFGIDGIGAYTATNRLVATVSAPVVDWLGRPLSGNGAPQSCLYQVIYAGTNGVIDPPLASGQVTGDDRLLYGSGLRQPWGRFGEGGMPVGQFMKSFDHALTSGVKIYVRAWDAPSFDGAVAYGDSALLTLSAAAVQTNTFATWVVGVPVNTNRDSNGDSIPDGYCVLNGMDPRDPIVALPSSWSFGDDPIGSGSTSLSAVPGQFKSTPPNPTRLFYKGDYLYVLDTAYNRLQVWNRYTRTYLWSYGSQGSVPGKFKRPMGLALDPRAGTNRFAVVDQLNFRVQVFSFDPATGTNISFQFEFGSYGNETNQFENPTDVAMAPDGRIYVTDIRNVSNQDRSVVQVFNEDGTYSSTLATWGTNVTQVTKPWGVCVGPDGMVVVADTENNRIQAWDSANGFLWSQPDGGSNGVTLFRPRDAEIGLDGRVYVADTDNSRIVVYRSDGSYIATLGTLGGGLNQDLRYPYAVAPVVESNIVYVADSYHYRVVVLAPIYDGDGDGMDDIWEELHGLDPNDPTDGLLDSNSNGILNIGEYRLGHDPQEGAPVRITAFSLNPSVLRWETVSTGGIYRIEYSCDSLRMASNSWIYGSVVTSPVVGSLAVTNMLTITNRVEYFRVKRIGP